MEIRKIMKNRSYLYISDNKGTLIGVARPDMESTGYEIATLENGPQLTPSGEADINPERLCFSPFKLPSKEKVELFFKRLAGETCIKDFIPAKKAAAKAA